MLGQSICSHQNDCANCLLACEGGCVLNDVLMRETPDPDIIAEIFKPKLIQEEDNG